MNMSTQEMVSLAVVAGCGYYLYANKQIDQTQALYAAIFLVVIYFLFIRDYLEGNTNVSQITDTILADENAFTGLDCVSDSLPIFRFKKNTDQSETLRCLVNPATNTCYNKGEFFGAGTAPTCNKFQETLVKEIRNQNSNARKVFDASNPYLVHECSVQGLKTQGHWCNNVYSELAKTDCSDKFISGKLLTTCNSVKNMNAFLQTQDNINNPVTPYSFKLSGASCPTQCTRQSGAIPPNPATYDCMIKTTSRGKVTGSKPDPDCGGTKLKMQGTFDAYQSKYSGCLSDCVGKQK